jgi:ParB family chromosome partitioning protein
VREHGVLQPVTAVRVDNGVEVHGGQRRSLAGREAKLQTIAVYVLDGKPPTTKRQRPSTIAHPIVTNDQRSTLTHAQRANCIT